MDPLRTLTAASGFFTRQEAKAAGYADRDITRMVRARRWTRFRRAAYAFTDEWGDLDARGRHRVRCNAVARSLGSSVALSHASGCERHDIDLWGITLDRVHVTRLDGAPGRIEGDVIHHEGFALDDEVMEVGGVQVLRPERCVLEAGSRTSNEIALCLLDAGLRVEAYDAARMDEQFELMQTWPFVQHLRIPVAMADGRSGSVGESRGRWLFRSIGLPAPALQHEVRDADGLLAGITDWHWEDHRIVGEFDGKMKYGRLLKPGQSPGDAVFEEKKREDLIRELTGCRFLRLVWSDLDDPRAIGERFARLCRWTG